MMQVIIDADLVIDYLLLQREEVENLSDIIKNQQCKLFITQLGFDKFISLIENIYSPEQAKRFSNEIQKEITVCSINYELHEQANSLNFQDFESALEVACATSMGISAILTHNSQNFGEAKITIFSVENLLQRLKLEECLDFSTVFDWRESLYLPALDTPSFPTLEVVDIMKYRIRNSINTVMEVFRLLEKEGFQGITCQELQKKYNYSKSKITNIIFDLQNFHMAKNQAGRIIIEQSLIDSEDIAIASYLAKFLSQHTLVQKIYKELKPNQYLSRAYLKKIISEIYPDDKYKNMSDKTSNEQVYSLPLQFDEYPEKNSLATKSAGDYISRMLGWLLFTGLLEKKNKEVILIPINEGKQKGKLLEENAIQQLELFQNSHL
ncbi:PIN domain-containing protein [Nostoc parmelioides]|uniref:PIN domain-containing protein n=1 Tax=Nostoc parmelioides FACHB-3921 TaxID=2692909 RepID=A0ABR8BLC8_9NOSO|nr:PIN domain-containing protein [Nostoc parmelioides]MBD2254688.1 hypothetical protein [Nostoc parmelioides FACHB-3921]